MKTIIKLIGVFLLVFSVMAGFASPGLSAEPIYVGLSAPLTGTYAEYGQNFRKR
jgi:ABC-type branched-subunit amino acid transport system substrate-binding protein